MISYGWDSEHLLDAKVVMTSHFLSFPFYRGLRFIDRQEGHKVEVDIENVSEFLSKARRSRGFTSHGMHSWVFTYTREQKRIELQMQCFSACDFDFFWVET